MTASTRSCERPSPGGAAHATCHELRHTCLTRLREAGMALEAIQAQAGHRSIETTRLYLHLSNEWLARRVPTRRRLDRCPDARGGGPMTPPTPSVAPARTVAERARGPSRRPSAVVVAQGPMARTARRYLAQVELSAPARWRKPMRYWPASVAPGVEHPEVKRFADVGRPQVESYKLTCRRTLPQGHAAQAQYPPAAPRHGAGLLRPHHRVGLPRRPGLHARVPGRHAQGPQSLCPKP